ncbi:MAG TPA: glycosyltransferase family 4 protein [Prolixibacteraceae bacterium]
MSIQKKKGMLMLTDGNCDNASARIRALQYIPFFEAEGYHVTHIPRIPRRPSNLISKYTVFPILKRWYFLKMVLAIIFVKWDIVFIQRLFISKGLLKSLNNRSIPIVYDFDDAIYINPKRPANREKTADMVRYANKVIVSTNYLNEFCLDCGQTPEIIPSPVETDRIRPYEKPINQFLTIGWIGSPWTSGFLELIEKPLKRLAEKYSFRFLTVGARPDYKIMGVNHMAKEWVFEAENENIGQMDIGLMPLPDNDWTRMKGGYKLLQYMAAGIPCVASPVGINQSIIKPGENGFLASNDEEWYLVLERLITDPELRIKLGVNGRKDAVELYSREVCFEKLLTMIKLL